VALKRSFLVPRIAVRLDRASFPDSILPPKGLIRVGQSRYSDGLRAGRPKSRVSIPCRGKDFSILRSVQTGSGAQPLIQRLPGALSPSVKRSGREADHSPPSNAEVKNGGAPLPIHRHDVVHH
jgi:hypothetical protein